MFTHADEIRCQYELLKILSHGDDRIVAKYILWHEGILPIKFREVIKYFENEYGRVPTIYEMIWCVSVDQKTDITKIFGGE